MQIVRAKLMSLGEMFWFYFFTQHPVGFIHSGEGKTYTGTAIVSLTTLYLTTLDAG